jgi:sugar O-acyltransferase (sialic acid O-acetyltransferase NeuD family)
MSKKIIIIGMGETAELAYEYFTYDSDYEVKGFAVEKEYIQNNVFRGLPVVSTEDLVVEYPPSLFKAFVAISSGKLNRNRRNMYLKIKSCGYSLVSYISSKAFVWRNVEIGENCFVLENNVLQPFTQIGNNVTLWSGNHVGHRSVIGDHCFVSSHCVISGFCSIGESSFLGVNCTLEDHVVIGPDNFIGAGAIIQKNTDEKSFYQEKQTELSKVNTHRLFRVK